MRRRRRWPLPLIQTLLAIVASAASIAGVCVTVFVTTGLPPFDSDSVAGPQPTEPISPAPEARPVGPTPTPSSLPDLLLSRVADCSLNYPASEGDVADLSLVFKVINRGDLEFAETIFLQAENSLGRVWRHDEVWAGDWERDEQEYAKSVTIQLELEPEDLDQLQEIVIRADYTNEFEELDESNNDTTVIVQLPRTLPLDNYQQIPCEFPETP